MLTATLLEFSKPVATAIGVADCCIGFSDPEFEELCVDVARLPGMEHPRLRRPLGPHDGPEFLRALPGAVYARYLHRRVALAWQRTSPTPEDERLDAIVAHLWARWTPVGNAEETLPDEPGLYAIWANPNGLRQLHRALPELALDPARPIYVGKSESSLKRRLAGTHFKVGETGHSTLRRSIAALLHRLDEVGPLRALPRNPQNPERFSNYALDDASEQVLQDWMEQHLSIAWWTPLDETTPQPAVSLGTLESALIGHPLWAAPPALNLKDLNGQPTVTARPIKAARKVLAKDAEAHAKGAKGPDTIPSRLPAPSPATPDPADPRRIWLDGGHNPVQGAAELVAVDSRLAAATTATSTSPAATSSERNNDAIRASRRGDRTLLICLDGRCGPTAAKVAADLLDLELSLATIALQTDDLVALLSRVNDAVRTESARAGEPNSHTALALAIVQDDNVRWATVGPTLIAVVDPDRTLRRLGTPRDHCLGQLADPRELEDAVQTGTTDLWPGGWLVLATEGFTTDATDWQATVLESALVRTHYPAADVRRGIAIPTAAAVAQDLVDATRAGNATAGVSALVLGRMTFSDLPDEQRSAALAAWDAQERGV